LCSGARQRPPDAARIASALEATNAYSRAPEQRQDAKRAVTAVESAASSARVTAIVAAIDTLITGGGVLLVWFTLREAKRTADAPIKVANATKETAEAALVAIDRPWPVTPY